MPREWCAARAPVAERRRSVRRLHAETVPDDYAWMLDHSDPQLHAYLRAERCYYDTFVEHERVVIDELTAEAEQRLPDGPEYSAPWIRGRYCYRIRTPANGDGYELLRFPRGGPDVPDSLRGGPDPPQREQRVLDVGALMSETGYAELGVCEPSPDGALLAWSVDRHGDELYALQLRDLSAGIDLPDLIPRSCGASYSIAGAHPGVAFSADARYLFYLVPDAQGRPYQLWRHRIGSSAGADAIVWEEGDARFALELGLSRSGQLIIVTAASRDTTEVRVIAADDPLASPRVIEPRHRSIEYRIDHARCGELFIVTNRDVEEFTLVRTDLRHAGSASWEPVRCAAIAPARRDTRLLACAVFAERLLLTLRRDGEPLLVSCDQRGADVRSHRARPDAGWIRVEHGEDYDAGSVLLAEESLLEPTSWARLELATGVRRPLAAKGRRGPGAATYRSERRSAPAPDGAQIPVTLAYHRSTALDGSAPCLLYGYGAYESCLDAEFLASVNPELWFTLPSLLDRGVVLALAHVRGGGERGRRWWRQGRLAAKPNTFSDYLAVADWLAGDGLAGDGLAGGRPGPLVDPTRIVSRGLSAGGLLQGAVYSQRPGRFCAVIAEVPFVDCVNTMLDPSIPLTVNEWDEWGDPRDPAAYAAIRSYAPYENPPSGARPPLLVTGALNDPRVGIHEPAKWVAKLRATDTRRSCVLFRADLGAGGHAGPSARRARLAYEAEIQAFVLHAIGCRR